MPTLKKGLEANNAKKISSSKRKKDLTLRDLNNKIQYGRVEDVILNSEYPNIEDYGGVNAIGGIIYKPVNFVAGSNSFAKPLFPQLSSPPLKNELVLIFKFFTSATNQFTENINEEYYYLSSVNLWNNPHCSPLPSSTKVSSTDPAKSYSEVEAGFPNKVEQQEQSSTTTNFDSSLNPSQNTFIEKDNIHPLLPFTGDNIFQGRWGNSIRLGSTALSFDRFNLPLNNWSNVGGNGNPITIIRNGQTKNDNAGFEPITENINTDDSSLYLTSNQLIPIICSNINYNSYSKDSPIEPSQFSNSQVVINSNRLLFNSNEDHILLSSQKSIFLGANSSFNVSTKETVIDSRNIKLGSKNATESMILGDKFLDNLEVIMRELGILCKAISQIKEVSQVNPQTGIPVFKNAVNGKLKILADNLSEMIEGGGVGFIDQINSYKSNVNKLI